MVKFTTKELNDFLKSFWLHTNFCREDILEKCTAHFVQRHLDEQEIEGEKATDAYLNSVEEETDEPDYTRFD